MRSTAILSAIVSTSFVLVGCGAAGSAPVTDAEDLGSSSACVTCDSSEAEAESGDPAQALPCEVQAIFSTHCGSCHAATPQFGAPMPLVDYGDLQVPAVTDPTRSVHALVAERMVDDDRPMPPTADVPEADVAAVLEWIAAGAPASTESCDPPDDTSDTEEPPYELPCEPTVVFAANGGVPETDFAVPLVDDLYQCFT